MYKLSKIIMVTLFLIVFSSAAFGSSLELDVDSIYFNADEKTDILGEGTSRVADGKIDASFTLAVSGVQAITEISLKNETTGKMWSSSPSNAAGLLIVKNSSGSIMNTSGRLPVTPVLMGADFKLYINDAEGSIPKDSDFTVIVTLINNQQVTGKTNVKAVGKLASVAPVAPVANAAEGISMFAANGVSQHDYAGTSEKVGADGKNDYQFSLALDFKDATVTAMKISAQTSSRRDEWDTIARNNIPIITAVDSHNNIMNRTDGTVAFKIKGSEKYTLLIQDKDGIMSDRAVNAKITISLSDGRMFERDAVRGEATTFKDTLSVDYRGTGKYDFTGQSERMESNLNADRQIDAVINASGAVTGVRIRSSSSGNTWDTIPGNNAPLVVLTDDKGYKQNKSDGTISMAINGTKTLYLWFDEVESKNVGPYHVTFVMSNGQVLEASTSDAPATSSKVTKDDRDVVFTSSKPTLVNLDHVGKNKKRAANGYKDTALNIKITGKGNVKALALTFDSGKGWDTLPENNGSWLLGVREGNKMLNHNNGAIRIPVNGTKTYQLLIQDNGDLRKRNGVVHITVTWADGEVTQSYLKW
ncbi:MAG: hypothetical protein GX672_07940 [Synergistaceae bacterium]|nr:hypothetical protein [Synergistaceae bacterium]